MYGRPTIWFPLALLALLALLTLWIDRSVQAPQAKRDGSSRHDPDYKLTNFSTTKTDVTGNPRYVLSASEMQHYPDDDSTHLLRPRLTQYDVNKPYTQIEGQRGLVSSNGDNVYFMDNVRIVRQAYEGRGEMTLLTEYLHLIPDQDLAVTDRPVVITQAPKTVVHGTGMIFNKKERTVQLLSKVRVHYERPGIYQKPAAPAGKKQALASSATNSKKNTNAGSPDIGLGTSKNPVAPVKSASKTSKPTPNKNQTRIRRQYEKPASP